MELTEDMFYFEFAQLVLVNVSQRIQSVEINFSDDERINVLINWVDQGFN